MLSVISIPAHAGLERAFRERIQDLKKDPLAALLIVAPSTGLVSRLEKLLAEKGLSYLNVHFHTLASFAESVVLAETELKKPLLSDPLYFDTLVKIILKEDRPFEALDPEIAVPEGFPPAVRSSLRDLLDAGVDENNVLEAMREEFLGRDVDLGTLRSLLRLHHLYLKRLSNLPVISRAALLKDAIERAPQSEWIKTFKEVVFYGFTDMTGNQTDFFQAVAKNHPCSFFFPYKRDHHAYAFAGRFRDTFLQPVMKEEIIPDEEAPSRPVVKILNTSGLRDEAWYVASEINRLHQEEKIPFSRMAVIVRQQNRLLGPLPRMLRAADIPFHSAAKEPFISLPFVQTAHDLVSAQEPEWTKDALWSEFTSRTLKLLQDNRQTFSAEEPMWELLIKGAEDMAKFDSLGVKTSAREFSDALRERWSRMERPNIDNAAAGVSLLYAEAARSLPFEVVFLVGVEEKVFPRVIREDPFLRDDARLALNMTLGHKISQKMTALEEERMLFEFFTHAASKHLTLLYQRSDDDGAVVGPSSFLRSFLEENNLSLEKDVVALPRQTLDKILSTKPQTLSQPDVIIGLLAAHQDKEALQLAKNKGRASNDLKRGLTAQNALHSFDKPGPYDGQIGKQSADVVFRGGRISPTALEIYGQCPFKYFALRVLDLEPKEEIAIDEALAADVRGTSIHGVLETFYKQVTQDGSKSLPEKFPIEVLNTIFDKTIGKTTAKEVNLHPALWEAVKINLKEMLSQSAEQDYQECLRSGFRPAFFEAEASTPLEPFAKDEIWLGKIDRIDVSESGGAARVVDYKTGRAPDLKSVGKMAIRGLKSQAPLYILLAEKIFQKVKKNISGISFVYLYIFDGPQSREFSYEEWTALRASIIQTIRKQTALIKSGNFIHVPGDYCSYCEVKPICRVNHSLSSYRAKKGAGEDVRALREQEVPRGN